MINLRVFLTGKILYTSCSCNEVLNVSKNPVFEGEISQKGFSRKKKLKKYAVEIPFPRFKGRSLKATIQKLHMNFES